MKLLKLFLVSVLTVAFTSCLGDTNNTMTQDFTPYCLTYVSDLSGNEILSSSASYKLRTNIDKGTMTMDVANLRLPNGTYVTFSIEDQRFSYNEQGATVLKVPSYTSIVNGTTHTITNFNFEYYGRYLNSQAFPLLIMSYSIDGQYDARIVYSPAYYWGTTTVRDSDGNTFTNNDTSNFYGVIFDAETKKATFGALGAKFAEAMPAMNMTFKNLDYKVNNYSYSVTGTDITPEIANTPNPNIKITDFKLEGTWNGNQYLTFTCTLDTEKIKGTYKVSATLGILPTTNNTQQ